MALRTRTASVILFALGIVAVASMVAYAFVLAMRSAVTVSQDLVVAGLAEAAARMGARHAGEVVLADYLADPAGITRPYGPHVTHFMDTKQFDPHWAPNPDGNLATFFYAHPGNDAVDNIPHDARLWYMSQGTQDQGSALYAWFGQAPIGEYTTSAALTGTARYIEPGRYDTGGAIVRFSDDAAVPDRNSPVWYDDAFRPVATRAQARYRVRYALNVVDLGGHLLWGRQAPFESAPSEWDHDLAQTYNPPFTNLISFLGANRDNFQSVFLGWGSTLANPDPANRTASGYFLPGFDAAGVPTAFETIPGIIAKPVTMSGKISATGMGGPPSWTTAERLVTADKSDLAHWALTPFGRASNLRPAGQALQTYYDARVSTPWRVNVLTAPALTVKAMLRAYLPAQLGKNVSNSRTEAPWLGWSAPAWPGLPSPQWGAGVTTTTVGPTPAYGPGLQVQSSLFAPPELAADNPFAAYASPDYGAAVTATTYDAAYPDGPQYWEDYAYLELNPAERGNHAARPLHTLGWFVDVFGDPVEPDWSTRHYQIPAIGGAVGSVGDGNGEWQAPDGKRHYRGWFNGRYNRWGGYSGGNLLEPLRGMSGGYLPQRRQNGVVDAVGSPRISYNLFGGNDNDRPYWHRDSYWMDLAAALANAHVVAKAQHLDRATCGTFFNTITWMGDKPMEDVTAGDLAAHPGVDAGLLPCLPVAAGGKGRGPNHVRELDRIFLATLGEYFGDETPAASGIPKIGILCERRGEADSAAIFALVGASAWPSGSDIQRNNWGRSKLKKMQASANIRSVYAILTETVANGGFAVDPLVAARKVANMELVLNDFRLSFFGANPTYADFAPMDFDGDGWACCSGYAGSTRTISGKAFRARAAPGGKGPEPDISFSLSGYFVFEKGRYWRVLTRGEVYDEVLRKPIHEVNLETAFTIDPEGRALNAPTSTPETTTLYSRWITNYYRGLLPVTQ